MRTWERVGAGWVQVNADPNGFNDSIMLATLCQVLLLNLGESPFFANYGIPAQQSIAQQIVPDLYIALAQKQFQGFFASLNIAKVPGRNPTYNISITTQQGSSLTASVPAPP